MVEHPYHVKEDRNAQKPSELGVQVLIQGVGDDIVIRKKDPQLVKPEKSPSWFLELGVRIETTGSYSLVPQSR